MSLTAEQVAGLAADAGSLTAGRGLASERRWSGLGQRGHTLWGLCQGSGSKPYQTQADLSGPAFRCSCPSRKFPCKHAVGLLLLAAGSAAAVPVSEPPEWVAQWLASRQQRAERGEGTDNKRPPADPQAQARREARRAQRVQSGLSEFERWLHDLVRQGFAQARERSYRFWDEAAERLVDAQAPALAGRVQAMGGIAAAGGGAWAEALLEEAGLVHLLLAAHHRLDDLPEPVRADVRGLIGWTVSRDEVLAGERMRDRWAVLGRVVEPEARLLVQRTWLHGLQTRRHALVLSFAAAGQSLDPGGLTAGTVVDASLAFYPSAEPLRALVAERHAAPEPLLAPPGALGDGAIADALAARAAALARQPWRWRLPVCLAAVVPVRGGVWEGRPPGSALPQDGGWLAAEPDGPAVRLACDAMTGWRLAALAGGRPVAVFGEWLREAIRPVSVFAEGRLVPL
ncbi:MAG TPA: SWIM zinc finger family protein [Streptosporangiaceae bacterium]|nr:SWIM zinc finger family protein [Streptosporangiaceae bacterium]